jgi:hypothetical protein
MPAPTGAAAIGHAGIDTQHGPAIGEMVPRGQGVCHLHGPGEHEAVLAQRIAKGGQHGAQFEQGCYERKCNGKDKPTN